MSQFTFDWNDGTQDQLIVEGNPQGSGPVSIKSVTNEGVDRSKRITFKTVDGKHSANLTVNQEGLREPFNCTDGVFEVTEGDFNVLKSKTLRNGAIVVIDDVNDLTGLRRKTQEDFVRY